MPTRSIWSVLPARSRKLAVHHAHLSFFNRSLTAWSAEEWCEFLTIAHREGLYTDVGSILRRIRPTVFATFDALFVVDMFVARLFGNEQEYAKALLSSATRRTDIARLTLHHADVPYRAFWDKFHANTPTTVNWAAAFRAGDLNRLTVEQANVIVECWSKTTRHSLKWPKLIEVLGDIDTPAVNTLREECRKHINR